MEKRRKTTPDLSTKARCKNWSMIRPQMMRSLIFLYAFLSWIPFSTNHLSAGVMRTSGIGARSSALGGIHVTGQKDGYGVAHNPASLDNELRVSWGMMWLDPQFNPISQVVVANAYTSDTFRRGNVDTDYPSVFAQAIGLSLGLFDNPSTLWGLSLGVTAILPLDTIAEIDTGENFVPEYLLYRSGAKRPEFFAGFGMEPIKNFRVGAGVQTGLAIDAETNLFLQNSVDRPSSLRLKTRAKPRLAPYFGLMASLNEKTDLGFNFRLPLKSELKLYLTPTARVFGNTGAGLDFNVTAGSSLFYEPASAELGGSWKHGFFGSQGQLFLQANYEIWKPFEPSAIRITNTSTSRCEDPTYCGINFSQGRAPDLKIRNILIPQIGEAIEWTDKDTLRVGYSFRPGIVSKGSEDQAVGNALDPDSHRFSLGYGRKFSRIFGSQSPLSLDLSISYQKLVARNVKKSAGIENGIGGVSSSQNEKIGSPSYTVGGYLLGAGLTLSLVF